jgi:multidrug efflux pump subunit AcrA (membrane-fusion protein)
MKSLLKVTFLALVGLAIGIAGIFYGRHNPTVDIQPITTIKAPFASYVFGTGVIESASTNIPIETAIPGIVTELYIKVGQQIHVGDALFKIDERAIAAKIAVAQANVKVAELAYKKIRHQYEIDKNLKKINPKAISKKIFITMQDDLALTLAQLNQAKAQVESLQKERQRHTVFSRIDGQVLQCKLRVGEYIDGNRSATPLIVLGSQQMNMRVDINENDLWRLQPENQAIAIVRGQQQLQIPLHFKHIEPYVVPKKNLTGLATERTDLRVLQVVYGFDKPNFPVYIGQQLDVFIQISDKH